MADWVEETLLKRNLVTEDRLKEARTEQAKNGEPIGKILVRKGYVREEDV